MWVPGSGNIDVTLLISLHRAVPSRPLKQTSQCLYSWFLFLPKNTPLKMCDIQATSENLRSGRWVGSKNTVQEILRLEMRLQGENIMGVKAGGYTLAVTELKCTSYLISLTFLICCFLKKLSIWESQVSILPTPPHPTPSEPINFFFAKDQEVKIEHKMCAFLKPPNEHKIT